MKTNPHSSWKLLPSAIAALLFVSSGAGLAALVTLSSPVAIDDGSPAFPIDVGYRLFAASVGPTNATVGGINFVDALTSGVASIATPEVDFYSGSTDPALNTLLDSRFHRHRDETSRPKLFVDLQIGSTR